MKSRTITLTIECPTSTLYQYARNPNNLPLWAPGFARAVRNDGGEWVVETAEGEMKITFAPENEFGVLDHQVTSADGTPFHNPMRVISNGSGCEVIFTLFQSSTMSDQQFDSDAELVTADLRRLKSLLEGLNTAHNVKF